MISPLKGGVRKDASFFEGRIPRCPFSIIKKGSQMGPFFKFVLAESWGFEPQMPFWGILA